MPSRSIAELERKQWPKPDASASHFHRRCYEALTKPLSELSASDMRVLISQNIGLQFVMPLAIEVLERTPLIETDHFKGDLLSAVLTASPDYYKHHSDMRRRVERVLSRVPNALDSLDHADFDASSEAIEEAAVEFRTNG